MFLIFLTPFLQEFVKCIHFLIKKSPLFTEYAKIDINLNTRGYKEYVHV